MSNVLVITAVTATSSGEELRMPSNLELEMCRFQGEHVTRIAKRLGSATAV